MKMFSKDGIEMMDVKSLHREGDLLVMKGKVMGSMSATIVLKPEDVWQALRLLSWSVLRRLPLILLRGYRRSSEG